MSSSREENVYLAKLAEQAERYEEMAEFMEKVVKTIDTEELTVEERNLLAVAYKNVIGPRRVSWKIISYIEQKEESKVIEDHVSIIRGKIETELTKICAGILNLLDSHLIPTASVAQSKAFYLRMKGDFHRYLAEFKTGAERKEAVESTLMAYKSAQDIALADLPPTHPASDEAISELDTLGEESYIDNAKIMELRDNLTVWTSDMNVHFCSQPDSFICWVENFQDEAGGDEIKEASKHETEETPQ